MMLSGPTHDYLMKKLGLSSPVASEARIKRKTGGSAKTRTKRAPGGAMPQTSGGMQQAPSDMGQMSSGSTGMASSAPIQTNPIQRKPMMGTPKQFGGFVSRPAPMQNANPQPQTQSFNDPNADAQPNTQLRKGGKVRVKAKRNS